MRVVEKSGRTVDEAVNLALNELQIDKDKADIEILEEGSKGLFGIFNSKACKVRVTAKSTVSEKAVDFLKNVFDAMELEVDVDCVESSDSIDITLNSERNGLLIGKRGETLDALQYLTSIAANKDQEEYSRIVLDSENYRNKRKETLINLAHKLAAKVARDRKNITLEPMNSHERRIIHSTLQNNKYVETTSVGQEPNRKVVISYIK